MCRITSATAPFFSTGGSEFAHASAACGSLSAQSRAMDDSAVLRIIPLGTSFSAATAARGSWMAIRENV